MKKILMFTLIVALFLLLMSCQSIDEFFTDKSKLQELSFLDEGRGYLIWQDKTYEVFGFVDPDSDLIDDLFGTIENEKYTRVYLCNGQKPEEWLIVLDSDLMGSYRLFKEASVTEIPEEFETYQLEP